MDYKKEIKLDNIPSHIAVIMDGNGRWAKQKGMLRVLGHRSGVKAVRSVVEAAVEIGVNYLTLYAFSTENWNRPKFEVNALMELLVSSLNKELSTFMKNGIKLETIGAVDTLPRNCVDKLNEVIEKTKNNDKMVLVLALSYSSKWEITNSIKDIVSDIQNEKISAAEIDETLISSYLSTTDYPDPELLIRTSGEHRISNFLLWQIAYAELYFTDKLWPDFMGNDFYEAIVDYQKRERRFGKTSEQIKK